MCEVNWTRYQGSGEDYIRRSFVVILVNEYYSGDQIKKNEIGGRFRRCGRRGEVHAGFWWGNTTERGHLEDPGIDGWLILKWIPMKWVHMY